MIKRLLSLCMAAAMMIGSTVAAFASTSIGTQSGTHYFQFLSESGTWEDLKTPQHWDNATGNVAYCLQHDKDSPPSNATYNEFNPNSLMSTAVQNGLRAILENGYPAKNGGFSADQARYATANAIRAYLSEAAGLGYNFMTLSRGKVRPKSGQQALYDWMAQLVQIGRTGTSGGAAAVITVSPSYQTWQTVGNQLQASLQVNLSNVTKYEITGVPNGVNIVGYTGNNGDNLLITAPTSMAGQEITLNLSGESSCGTVSMFWYAPGSGNYQSILVVDSASLGGVTRAIARIGGGSLPTPVPTPTPTPELTIEPTPQPTPTPPPRFEITVNKVDDEGNPLNGAQFVLSGTSGSQSFTAGVITIPDLLEGDYHLVETSVPEGYIVSGDQNITLFGGNQTATVVNKITALELTKTDSLTGGPIADVVFQIKNISGQVMHLSQTSPGIYRYNASGSATFATDDLGKAIIKGLPLGNYTIEEVTAPLGYAVASTKTIGIDNTNHASNPAKVAVQNEPLTLEFTKKDALTGELLDGATFRLLNEQGQAITLKQTVDGEYVPDLNGNDTFTTKKGKTTIYYLPIGTYTIREEKAALGYAKAPDKQVEIRINNGLSSPAKQFMQDEPLALTIQKVDAKNGLPVGGAEFSLVDEVGKAIKVSPIEGKQGYFAPNDQGDETFPVDNTGKVHIFYLPSAVYKVIEVQAPDGFAIVKEPMSITVHQENGLSSPAHLEVKNQPLVFELTKIDALTKRPLSGISFKLLDTDNRVVKLLQQNDGSYKPAGKGDDKASDTFVTNSNGKAAIQYLPIGTYTVEELPVDGYIKAQSQKLEITAVSVGNTPARLTFENTPTKMMVEKLDASNGKPMDGAVFKLIDKDGKAILLSKQTDGSYRPDPKGAETFTVEKCIATITHLPFGTLTIEEVSPPIGYALAKPIKVEITDQHSVNEPFKVPIADKPLAIKIKKVTKENKPLAEAGFSIKVKGALDKALFFSKDDKGIYRYDPNGKESIIMVNKQGEAFVYSLPLGEYQLEETVVPEGYFPATPQKIILKPENDTENPLEVTVVNELSVKLGFDHDRWRIPLVVGLITLAIGCGAFIYLHSRKLNGV